MGNFKIGEHYDAAFKTMPKEEIKDNLDAIAYGLVEQSYTKNLTEEELAIYKHNYSEVGVELDELAQQKKDALDRFKLLEKEPKETAKMLLQSIKFKSEQKHGKLYTVDDQEARMMYFFDETGVCVDARPLTKDEQ